jgi:hypothetical protein
MDTIYKEILLGENVGFWNEKESHTTNKRQSILGTRDRIGLCGPCFISESGVVGSGYQVWTATMISPGLQSLAPRAEGKAGTTRGWAGRPWALSLAEGGHDSSAHALDTAR